MAQRVLVFEKDANFVRELEEGFRRVGAEVELVRDADAAIAQTRAGNVALILLSVDAMDTPGEAFLVCKRFKSDDELAKTPFVIMGGAQHAESFDSHKKLKKRKADEYVEQPVSFGALLAQVGPLAGFHNLGDDASVVDEDIDEFADNAFGELIREDSASARTASEPVFFSEPDNADASEAQNPEALDKLRQELAQAEQRARDAESRLAVAEERAERAEARAESAESGATDAHSRVQSEESRAEKAAQDVAQALQRASEHEQRARELEARLQEVTSRAEVAEKRAASPATATGSMGISSRDYLDLREQLNRKDKELLALRDEVTQRDRQLIDGSDRSLQLERVQAELHDGLLASQRQLEDAQTKIRAYEVDREAVSKRLEDFRGRLSRAEDKGKRLEDELEGLKTSSAREIGDLRTAHAQALEAVERGAATEQANLRDSHAAAQADLEARTQRELASAAQAHESALASLRASHQQAAAEAGQAHEAELEERGRAAEAALASALSEAAAERAQALETLATERAQELERRLADAEQARLAALAGLERELEAKHASERKELEAKHASAVAALQKQLTDSQTHASVLSDRISEIEAAKADLDEKLSSRIGSLEGDLAQRTKERDTAHNELSAMRASIASLERSGAQLSERLSALEVDLGRANDRIDQQGAKIALDKELLDRVRRALGIGIGLLEQQKQNVV